VISGGQSLLPLLKLRLGTAEHLVDIGRIAGLEYWRPRSSRRSATTTPATSPAAASWTISCPRRWRRPAGRSPRR
jgi:hypothetical protein